MQFLSYLRKVCGGLVFVVLCVGSFNAHAGVKSMLLVKNGNSDQDLVKVVCTNSRTTPMISRESGNKQWCGVADSTVCADSKLSMAKKACKNKYLRIVSNEGNATTEELKTEEPKKVAKSEGDVKKPEATAKPAASKAKSAPSNQQAVAAKQAAAANEAEKERAEIEKARLEVERESLQIEREKVALEREELELMRLEMKLERKTKSANGDN